MPTYEYLCEANHRIVEVHHKLGESLSTWGELCARAGLDPGATAANAPVRKLMSAGFINTGATAAAPPCETGQPCCGGGLCEPN